MAYLIVLIRQMILLEQISYFTEKSKNPLKTDIKDNRHDQMPMISLSDEAQHLN